MLKVDLEQGSRGPKLGLLQPPHQGENMYTHMGVKHNSL